MVYDASSPRETAPYPGRALPPHHPKKRSLLEPAKTRDSLAKPLIPKNNVLYSPPMLFGAR